MENTGIVYEFDLPFGDIRIEDFVKHIDRNFSNLIENVEAIENKVVVYFNNPEKRKNFLFKPRIPLARVTIYYIPKST